MLAGRPHEAVGNGSPRWMAVGPRKRVHRTRPTGQLTRRPSSDLDFLRHRWPNAGSVPSVFRPGTGGAISARRQSCYWYAVSWVTMSCWVSGVSLLLGSRTLRMGAVADQVGTTFRFA